MFDLNAINNANDLINLTEQEVIDLCNTLKVKPKGKDKSWSKRIQMLADHFAFILPEGWQLNDPTESEESESAEPELEPEAAITPVLEEEIIRAMIETRELTGSDEMPPAKNQLLDYLKRGTVATGGKKRTKKTSSGVKRISLWQVPGGSLEEHCLAADVKLPQLLIIARACDSMKEKYFSKSDICEKVLETGEIDPDKVTNAVNFYFVYLKLAGLRPVK